MVFPFGICGTWISTCNTAFYSLLSYFLAGRVVSAFHGSCDPGGAPAQRSVCVLNVPPWTALYSGWASACLSLACMWGASTWLALLYCNLPQPVRIRCPAEPWWFEERKWLSHKSKSWVWKQWPPVLLETVVFSKIQLKHWHPKDPLCFKPCMLKERDCDWGQQGS